MPGLAIGKAALSFTNNRVLLTSQFFSFYLYLSSNMSYEFIHSYCEESLATNTNVNVTITVNVNCEQVKGH